MLHMKVIISKNRSRAPSCHEDAATQHVNPLAAIKPSPFSGHVSSHMAFRKDL